MQFKKFRRFENESYKYHGRTKKRVMQGISKITFKFRKKKNIKYIYFAPFSGLDDYTGNVLEVTLVRDSSIDDDLEEKLRAYNLSHQEHDSIRKFGLKIVLDTDVEIKYTIMDLNPSECVRSNNLMNSVILYDENGKFTQIKEQTTNVVKNNGEGTIYYHYDNFAEVFPPLDEELDRALDVAHMERDTEAVKEFTKSKLFQHIKNMQ